ncbi:MAG: heavy metal translocating P-type ATPase [Candidatus Parabeggiatoa sp. nov. 1]|nr:MAG: heavy metal translocating P-type ATPase [Gammaproteobacteria bacterium]
MLQILMAGSVLTYVGTKLYQHLNKKEIPSSLQAMKILKEKVTPISKEVHHQQNQEMLPVHKSEFDYEKSVNQELAITSVSLGLATAGALVYPPLIIASLAGLAYVTLPIVHRGYRTLVIERRIGSTLVDAIVLPCVLVSGHYIIAALSYWLYSSSEKLVLKTKDYSQKSLISVFGEQPRFVWTLTEGVEVEIPLEALKVGDIVVVNAGENVPVDGTITDGAASIDQHILTGEAQPSEKEVGDQVFASTVVLSGKICIRNEKAGKETIAAKIGDILNHTADFKTTIQSRGEELADRSALPILGTSAVALVTSGASGALAAMFVGIGMNMKMLVPLSVLNFLNLASANNILIKDGRALEMLSQVDTIVFDKTGTLTQDKPHVEKVYMLAGYEENELLTYAAAAEQKQTHPIAKAILQFANERGLSLPKLGEAKYEVGYGIKVNISNKLIRVGSSRFMEMEGIAIPEEIRNIMSNCHEYGYSLIMIAIDEQLGGAIELHATLRPGAKSIINKLRQRNLSLYIISGDHEKPTKALAEELGIDNYFAEVLPENKASLIEQLQQEGKVVCFVGDGINDSIALKKAHVSISLRGASTIATDTAQIILMNGDLNRLDQLFEIAQALDNNINIGIISSIAPGMMVIGGVFLLHFGILSALVIESAGLALGLGNSMLPLINHQRKPHIIVN